MHDGLTLEFVFVGLWFWVMFVGWFRDLLYFVGGVGDCA